MERLQGVTKASDLIGTSLKTYEEKTLGKVDDVAVDVESGRVVLVILSTGGVAGIGDTLKAVPPSILHYDADKKAVHLKADEASLKQAPKFDAKRWSEQSGTTVAETYRYYSQEERAVRFIDKEGRRTEVNRGQRRGQSTIPESRFAQLRKGSALIGTPVRNLQDEKLGKIEDFLVDLGSGRVVAMVVSSGGFIGLGDELSAVPPGAFKSASDGSSLQLDASKDGLARSPHFKANEWPDFNQPVYAEGIYRAYKVDPYFTTNRVPADNTRRNVRDRDDSATTPLSQGNSKADLDTTALIRKQVVGSSNLSINAQNVKIITSNGRVTLRGTVSTAEEKRMIGEIANSVARAENVDNQIEVK